MGINDKKNCILWGFTKKSDFQGWFPKKNNIQGRLSKKEGLGQFADLKGGLENKDGGVFERVDTQTYVMGN